MSWGGGEEFKTGVTPIQFAKTEKIKKKPRLFPDQDSLNIWIVQILTWGVS